MTEEHDIDERDEFPEEAFTQIDELCRDTINERDRDRQRDERHHAGFSFFQFRDCHLQKWNAAIAKDNQRKDKGNPFTEGEHRRRKAKPHLDHPAVCEYWNAEQETPPNADAEHLLMTAVVRAMTSMSRMIFLPKVYVRRPHMALTRRVIFFCHCILG